MRRKLSEDAVDEDSEKVRKTGNRWRTSRESKKNETIEVEGDGKNEKPTTGRKSRSNSPRIRKSPKNPEKLSVDIKSTSTESTGNDVGDCTKVKKPKTPRKRKKNEEIAEETDQTVSPPVKKKRKTTDKNGDEAKTKSKPKRVYKKRTNEKSANKDNQNEITSEPSSEPIAKACELSKTGEQANEQKKASVPNKELTKKSQTKKPKKVASKNLSEIDDKSTADNPSKPAKKPRKMKNKQNNDLMKKTDSEKEISTENHDSAETNGKASDDKSESENSPEKPIKERKKREKSTDTAKPPLICEKCGFTTTTRTLLKKHDDKCHKEGNEDYIKENPFKCSVCDYRAKKIGVIKGHLKKHGLRMCNYCDYTAEQTDVDIHMRNSHSDKVTSKLCKTCGRYIKCDSDDFETHFENCDGKKRPYTCKTCGKEYEYASALKMHSFTHDSGPKKFHCEKCNYKTHYKINLQKHMANKHAENREKNIPCPECDKKFFNEDNLRRHLVSHSEDRPYSCEECSKTFKTAVALKGHLETHITDRPYACGIDGCGKSFKSTKLLRLHQDDIHKLLPRKFKCNFDGCDYIFFKSSHLIRHRATHTGERKYACDWMSCGKAFRHADNLKVHYRQHTNEKPVKCHMCDFACRQRNSLTWHLKRQHPETQLPLDATDNGNYSNGSTEVEGENVPQADMVEEPAPVIVKKKRVYKRKKKKDKVKSENEQEEEDGVKDKSNNEVGLLDILSNLDSLNDESFADAEDSEIDEIVNLTDPVDKKPKKKRVYKRKRKPSNTETKPAEPVEPAKPEPVETVSEEKTAVLNHVSENDDTDVDENKIQLRRILSPRTPKSPRCAMSNWLISKPNEQTETGDVYAFTSDCEEITAPLAVPADSEETKPLQETIAAAAATTTTTPSVETSNNNEPSQPQIDATDCDQEMQEMVSTDDKSVIDKMKEKYMTDEKSPVVALSPLDIPKLESQHNIQACDYMPVEQAMVPSVQSSNYVSSSVDSTVLPSSEPQQPQALPVLTDMNESLINNAEDDDLQTEEQIIDSINPSDFEKESKELFDNEEKINDQDMNDINIPRCEGEIIDRQLLQKYLEDATMDEFEKEQLIKDTEPKSEPSDNYTSMLTNNDSNCTIPPSAPPQSNQTTICGSTDTNTTDVSHWNDMPSEPDKVVPTSWPNSVEHDKQLTHGVERLYDSSSLLPSDQSALRIDGASYRPPDINGTLPNFYDTRGGGLMPPIYPGSGYSTPVNKDPSRDPLIYSQSASPYLPLATSIGQSGPPYLDPYNTHNRQQYENPLGSLAMSTAKYIESEVSKTVERRVYSQQGWALQETQSLRLTHSLFPGSHQNWEASSRSAASYPYIDHPSSTRAPAYLPGQPAPDSLDKQAFDRYDMAYLNSRHPSIGQPPGFNQLPLGGAPKALTDQYRSDYHRSLAHTPSATDLYSTMDKYFYPRDAMYTTQRVPVLQPDNLFLSQPPPPQHNYVPRDYPPRYPQTNPYDLMADKQYPDCGKYSQPMPTMQGREIFMPRPGSSGTHIQDPYRASMPLYNMMNRGYM